MKLCAGCFLAAASFLAVMPVAAPAEDRGSSIVYETPHEFFGSGDFDGDGRTDLVIVDKESGKFRLGYQLKPGAFEWVDCRLSGTKDISGFSIGRLLTTNLDAFAFTSPDANQITLVGASSSTAPSRPVTVPFAAALGPNTVVAVDIGDAGKTRLNDLYIGSIYNSPEPSQATLLRNDGAAFPKIGEAPLPGPATRGNRLSLKPGQAEVLCVLITGEKGDTLRLENLSSGKPVAIAAATGLPAGSQYAAVNFRGAPLREFIFYKPGESNLTVRPLEEPSPGQFQFGKGNAFDLGQAVRRVIALNEAAGRMLLVIFGEGQKAGVFNFDGQKAPVLTQTILATNESFTCAASLPGGFMVFTESPNDKFSTHYQWYKLSGPAYAFSAFGGLASLADNDNITIPDIQARIVANSTVKTEGEMRAYTNSIPGTRVTYALVPIPGGEFIMGSPENEPGRRPDEGPQHRVRISPFWMGQYEVTWNEYEFFMYPDQEKQMRVTLATDPATDKLADAVTHPSKPYVDMSFNMGKEGFPAISMTQHAANKYCQWLSAKTGHFYRLPTEAEWEYAARAGTTNAYFFGDDPSKLGEYAWFEQNSDFKYQKVGKKKPNPWGLYDICGNVAEWVLDQYDPDFYRQCNAGGVVTDPWNKATQPYPHSVRGGSWDDEAVKCRSAARRGSDRSWKMTDPQLPKSVFYFTDAQFVGFRIMRPLKVPSPEEMQKYWTSGVEKD